MNRFATTGLLAILLVTGCGEADSGSPGNDATTIAPSTTEGNLGGFGAPAQSPGEFGDGVGRLVTGELRLDERGCWYLSLNGTERLLALPPGFEIPSDDGAAIVAPDGGRYASGAPVDGSARFVSGEAVPGGADGRWGGYLTFCAPRLDELVVLDHIEPAFDPTTLGTAAIADRIEAADFTEAWPCGRGWAVSTADQTVGVLIHQLDERPPDITVPLRLPSPHWSAEVVVGKFLFVQNCDDAVEEWEPDSVIVGRWPIVSGSIEILDSVPGVDDPPAEVRAVLTSATVDVADAEMALPVLELVNTDYNAFAG